MKPLPQPARRPSERDADRIRLTHEQRQPHRHLRIELEAAADVDVEVHLGVRDIARRAVELMSDKVIREIAWEIVPELAELLIKRQLEERSAK